MTRKLWIVLVLLGCKGGDSGGDQERVVGELVVKAMRCDTVECAKTVQSEFQKIREARFGKMSDQEAKYMGDADASIYDRVHSFK